MGVAGLIEIKQRIKSIENTKKITKAMGLVATSKLRKVKQGLEINNSYKNLSEEILREVVNLLPDSYESIYLDSIDKKLQKKLYIVASSETGLCGGFNNSVISFLNDIIVEDNVEYSIVLIGKRGTTYLNKYNLKYDKVFEISSELPSLDEVNSIYKYIIELYNSSKISEVSIIYTEFKSHVKQEVVNSRLLPFVNEENSQSNYNIESNIEEAFNRAVDGYLKSKIMNSLINSRCSEESSRRAAMEGATTNAEDILRSLNKKFNRIRQSIITQEISEIVSGAEAQK